MCVWGGGGGGEGALHESQGWSVCVRACEQCVYSAILYLWHFTPTRVWRILTPHAHSSISGDFFTTRFDLDNTNSYAKAVTVPICH